ncbi:MAG TPA: bifunctional 4-hydroxy-2-oxoglutarate aldolase/2-dehydro-3-deoxy-phosphogluconate aldolase [Chitinophagaceae bacterium]|nr:bifunctional 4-hydroxy-2-oxoglutarate aldolase/2-dehydro-3-deoxy-phosphogluconate aldolase [Chitinophagaceae bacterium]
MKEKLLQHAIIAIIRGVAPADVPAIIDALYQGGIRAAEITLNSDGALPLIAQLRTQYDHTMLIGAGTVLSAADALEAIAAGAQFIISPSLDVETIAVTRAQGVVSIPGAYTATEIVQAHAAGADIVKVFPASSPQYIKDLRGPLNHIPLMPTGGVNLQSIHAFKAAGAVAFGIGSALVDSKETVTAAYLSKLRDTAMAFVEAIR